MLLRNNPAAFSARLVTVKTTAVNHVSRCNRNSNAFVLGSLGKAGARNWLDLAGNGHSSTGC